MPANKDDWSSVVDNEELTIETGQTESGALDCRGGTLCGVYIPSGFTGTSFTIFAAPDAANFVQVKDGSGADLTFNCGPDEFVPIDPASTAGMKDIKIVSGSAEAAERTLVLAVRRI